eukprot:6189486-Pleurochrysis_carterae.AAC.1
MAPSKIGTPTSIVVIYSIYMFYLYEFPQYRIAGLHGSLAKKMPGNGGTDQLSSLSLSRQAL